MRSLIFLALHLFFSAGRHHRDGQAPRPGPGKRDKLPRLTMIGESGAGKSTLINVMFGKRVAKEGCSTEGVTKETTIHANKVSGEMIVLVDTVGYHALEPELLTATPEEIDSSDLILFCSEISMQMRINYADREALRALRNHHAHMLGRLVIVLTFANRPVRRGSDAGQEPTEVYEQTVAPVVAAWRKVLQQNLSKELAESIPIVPAGRHRRHLLGDIDWYTNLWVECGKRATPSCSRALLNIATSVHTRQEEYGFDRSPTPESVAPPGSDGSSDLSRSFEASEHESALLSLS